MRLCIIVPVKPFDEAKRRLSPVLDAKARAELARRLFLHVVSTAARFADGRNVIVVSRAPEVLLLAKKEGAIALEETSRPDLNAALVQASAFAGGLGATRLLVVAGDLPLVHAADLAAITDAECAIAPDRHQHGTNALLWPAIPAPEFKFGENSFQHHVAMATASGFEPRIVTRTGLAHDVDVPEDLRDLPA
jgi:2-phospho-L-lactate guanylyltransferase